MAKGESAIAAIGKDRLKEMYQSQLLSIPEISGMTGVSRSTVRLGLIACGVTLRSRSDGVRLCSEKLSMTRKGKRRVFTEQWKLNLREAIVRRHARSAVGMSFKTGRYVVITMGVNKHRGLHVVLMERQLGRKLMPNEVVHHIDGDKHNNTMTNLQVMTRAEHSKLHAQMRKQTNHG